ncbi:MAG: UDP-N-acetylmuramate dehydrogenase [Anaerolineales bacterium]|nr:UDP-N-acetylmuramate dehydrogenase [Anaerolineales bacterium]
MRREFGDRLQEGASLAPYTSARIGGPADFLLEVRSVDELTQTAVKLWQMNMPFRILGGGSNILISDRGVRGVVVLNHARGVKFHDSEEEPKVSAESGASLGAVGRRTVERGWLGLEWAATVPGTIGGAVVGNAGAHGGDINSSLEMAEILQRNEEPEVWPVGRFQYAYRDSVLKRNPGSAVVLTATFHLRKVDPNLAKVMAAEFSEYRQRTQPAGASWGSMFKNPPERSAGRLIEAAGLKGLQIGGARVSAKHANFILNLGNASATDVLRLIKVVRREVADRFDISLDLEVELFGDWDPEELEGAGVTGGMS